VLVVSILVLGNLILVFYKASWLIKMIIVKYWHRLGRFLDPMYLKPIPKPPVEEEPREVIVEEEKVDELLLDLRDLVGEDERVDGYTFTFREQDQMIED